MALCACAAVGLFAAGCGEKDFANNPRPPTTIQLTALISDKRVIISPQPKGAGPVTITISNQSSDPATLTLTKGDVSELTPTGGSDSISSAKLTPNGGTGSLQTNLKQGTYTALADNTTGIKSQVITVGPERKSAQNDLLLP
ncbi:hypothetical protein BH10ACT11_BH10ACT11_18010 [soil metagenome]